MHNLDHCSKSLRDVKDLRNIESILRSVLSYPSRPAVVMTASFSLMDKIEMGVDAHLPVAQYYDVPESRISHRLGNHLLIVSNFFRLSSMFAAVIPYVISEYMRIACAIPFFQSSTKTQN
jgi:hypothetical protein